MQRTGYTLIELLAGLGAPALVRRVGDSSIERVSAILRQGHEQARFLSFSRGMDVTLGQDGMGDAHDADNFSVQLPTGASVSWLTHDEKPLRLLSLDARGRSVDFLVEIVRGSDRRRYRIAGISGEWNGMVTAPLINGEIVGGEKP
jgi:hypothetical protein